jgi:hypothetical protein
LKGEVVAKFKTLAQNSLGDNEKKTHENLTQGRQNTNGDLNPEPPESNIRVFPLQ